MHKSDLLNLHPNFLTNEGQSKHAAHRAPFGTEIIFPFSKELSRQTPDLPDCFYPWLISIPQWTPGPAGSLSAGTACPLQTAWSCCSILPWLSDKLPELPAC